MMTPHRHESKSYQTDITYVIYRLKKLKVVILIPPKLELFHKTLFIVQQQIFTLHVHNVYLQTIITYATESIVSHKESSVHPFLWI